MIGEFVARLIASGAPPEVAAEVVAEVFAAGVSAVRPQISADVSADNRREKDRIRKQLARENPQTSAEIRRCPQMSESASISKDSKKESKRQNRGSRVDAAWSPSADERAFAKQEGFSDYEIDREAQKFRDYWTACAGTKGVKLDWSATWRQWIRNSADRAGKRPAPSAVDAAVSGYYAEPGSLQLEAWDRHNRDKHGKSLPRDRIGGWRVASEWPPGWPPPELSEAAE